MDETLYKEMHERERTYWWFRAKRRILSALIDKHRPKRSGRPRLIDLGCGTGALLRELRDRYDVAGMDTHPLALEVCRAEGLDARAGTLPDELPFEPGSADVVVLSDVLEHVEPDHASAAAAAKLLRAGGILVCTVPAHPWMWTPRDDLHHHVRRYRKREYERVFENAGCERVLVSWYNTTLFPAMIAARSIAKWSRSTPSPDVRGLPAPLNATLDAVFSAERAWLTRGPLPFGASLISVYRRRPN